MARQESRYLFAVEMGLDGLLVVARTFPDGDVGRRLLVMRPFSPILPVAARPAEPAPNRIKRG
jgi:hypothetical protein